MARGESTGYADQLVSQLLSGADVKARFDDKTISTYARGMATRETRGNLRDLYGINEVIAARQNRPRSIR